MIYILFKNALSLKSSLFLEYLLRGQDLNRKLKNNTETREVFKVMMNVCLYMVKHRLPNDSFEDMMNLVANSGSTPVKNYLSKCRKNATFLSHHSHHEILETMNEFVETPILEAAKNQWFTIFIDETTIIGNKSIANVYIMFDDNNSVKEHYLGTVCMNVGMGLTANHFYEAAKELCEAKGISLCNCAFSEMDGCATNQGKY